jgi:VWFA-related protein
VVVTDRLGKLVNNLTRDDFELFDGERPTGIASFSTAGKAPGARIEDSGSLNASSPPRSVAFFVDTLHLTRERLPRVKQLLTKFVDQHLTWGGEIAITSSSGALGALEQFTRDRALLRRAISRLQVAPVPASLRASLFTPYLAAAVVRDAGAADSRVGSESRGQPREVSAREQGRPLPTASQVSGNTSRVATEVMLLESGVTASAEDARNRAAEVLAWSTWLRRESLARLRAVSQAMSALPGPRVIVLVSDGFSMADSSGMPDQADLRRTLGTAGRSGTVIYSLDLNHETEFAPAGPSSRQGQSPTAAALQSPVTARASLALRGYLAESSLDLSRGVQELASGTGGKVLLNISDPTSSIEKAIAENTAFYSLGFYSAFGAASSRPFRPIRVGVKTHPEYSVRAPSGYLPVAPPSGEQAETPAQKLLSAISESKTLGAIGLSTSSRFVVSQGDEGQCLIQVFIDASSRSFRTSLASAYGPTGWRRQRSTASPTRNG